MSDAALVVVDDGALSGTIESRHGSFLAARLAELGVALSSITIVGDDAKRIADAIVRAEAGLVVVAGGSGPASHNLTLEAITVAAGVRTDERRDARKGPEQRRALPAGFEALENLWGVAPGLVGLCGDAVVAAFPGEPEELRKMAEHHLGSIVARRWPDLAVREAPLGRPSERRVAEAEAVVLPAELLVRELVERDLVLAAAESCTGGLIGATITDVAGSSAVFWGSLVTYANDAKVRILGVPASIIEQHGAVSRECAMAMIDGLARVTPATVLVAVSGIAGPGGGSPDKPVGTVWIAAAKRGAAGDASQLQVGGDRERVRRISTLESLMLVRRLLRSG